MKNAIITVIIVGTILCVLGKLNTTEAHYSREVKVVEVQDQEVTVEDRQGHCWSFFGDGYTVDQEITVVMYDNHTSIITDDEIVRVM